MTHWSRHIVCGPPWITTNSGYFLRSSKAGGSAIILWTFRPREFDVQNSRSGCRSRFAAFSTLNDVEQLPFAGRGIEPHDLGRVYRAVEIRYQDILAVLVAPTRFE